MHVISTLNKISADGLSVLPKEQFEIRDNEANPDGIILRSFSMLEMEMPERLQAIARAGAGVNNIPIDKCTDKGIVVFNTPGANANAVKELVLAGLFMSSRRIVEGINWVSTLAEQPEAAKLVEKGKGDYAGPEIMGKKLGIIGLGAIGQLVANAAAALGMEVTAFRASRNTNPHVKTTDSLDEIYAHSDYISIHAPYNSDTKHMINETSIAKMKKGVRILNFARGELVCNESIKKALEAGTVSCYVTDFPSSDIINVKNLITIPHLGASSPESEENCAYMAAVQLRDFLNFGNIVNSVNFPAIELAYTGKRRICATFMDSQKAADFAAKVNDKCTVAASACAARGKISYYIADIECNCDLVPVALEAGAVKARMI